MTLQIEIDHDSWPCGWPEYLRSGQHRDATADSPSRSGSVWSLGFLPWMIMRGLRTPSHALLEVIAGMTLVRSSPEYLSLGQYYFCLVSSVFLHQSPRMFLLLLPFLYSIPFAYFPTSPFRTCWRYGIPPHGPHCHNGRLLSNATLFSISFPHPLRHPSSNLWNGSPPHLEKNLARKQKSSRLIQLIHLELSARQNQWAGPDCTGSCRAISDVM